MKSSVNVRRPRLAPGGYEVLRVQGALPTVPLHVHASWCVLAVENGERELSFPVGQVILRAGQAVLIPPGMPHACAASGPDTAQVAVSLPETAIPVELARAGHLNLNPRAARLALDADRDPDAVVPALLRVLIEQLRAEPDPCRDPASAQPVAPAVRAARNLLESEQGLTASLEDLASHVGASPFHLARSFGSQVGVSPNVFRTLARLRSARSLLARGVPPALAALESGFYDQSHLITRFRTYMGFTPGRYVRGMRP